ncbi:DUF5131 family protein [Vineibacter terrae]|uniref:DUF5131 family protein n=1 Tax=Vineibacter terrae TaxID=2586908 RepID=A0A5C8P995_9HYPH|nr:DUF5131 family protein [Vineibacter terrae]TXL70140.1 DUF5131 family protein [Vineibacter terrae]
MGDKTSIEWCDSTWNPVRARSRASGKVGSFCARVSAGCRHCYAEAINLRLGNMVPFSEGRIGDVEIYLDGVTLMLPFRWRRPRRIFLHSMSDTFGAWVTVPMLARIYAVMALCPQHEFVVLTKRGDRMRIWTTDPATPGQVDKAMNEIAPAHWCTRELDDAGGWPLRNVTAGVSAEDQPSADERIPELLAAAAARRIVSLEPLLGPVDILKYLHACPDCFNGRTRVTGHFFDEPCPACDGTGVEPPRLDGIIVGGESGRRARPLHPDPVRSLRDQAARAGAAFFFKQWGEWAPKSALPDGHGLNLDDMPYGEFHAGQNWVTSCLCSEGDGPLIRVGKKRAGRLLDGVEHTAWPKVA